MLLPGRKFIADLDAEDLILSPAAVKRVEGGGAMVPTKTSLAPVSVPQFIPVSTAAPMPTAAQLPLSNSIHNEHFSSAK